MAYTLADVANMEAALAAGTRSVTRLGTSLTFNSRDEMIAQLELMRTELGLIDPPPKVRRIRFRFGKGL